MEKAVKELDRSQDDVKNAALDKKLHYTLAQASGNILVQDFLEACSGVIDLFIHDMRAEILRTEERKKMLNEYHKKLIEALKEKDETKGQEALKCHFMLINEILKERENRKVLIADDQELIRESLKIILGAHDNIEIVGVVGNGYEVLETLKKHKVDIILMDIRMPKMDGVYCTKLVKEQYPEIKIVILTTFDDDEYIFSALKYGASGYLLKDVGMEELYEDIMVIYNGGALINPDIATKVVSMFSNMSRNRNLIINVEGNCLDELSKNEWKIVQNIGLGLSNKEIAKKMFLSEGTVRNYLSSILSKLDLRDRTQLAIWAVQTGQIAKDFDND